MAGTRVQSAMVGKAQQLCEAAGSHSSAAGRRRDESWCQLAFFLVQSLGWCLPHSECVFPVQSILSGNSLTHKTRAMSPR